MDRLEAPFRTSAKYIFCREAQQRSIFQYPNRIAATRRLPNGWGLKVVALIGYLEVSCACCRQAGTIGSGSGLDLNESKSTSNPFRSYNGITECISRRGPPTGIKSLFNTTSTSSTTRRSFLNCNLQLRLSNASSSHPPLNYNPPDFSEKR
jgi:hypothetical protein